MVNLNRFKLEFFLGRITNNWTRASFNRYGDLVIKAKDLFTAEKLIKTTSIGEYKVEITKHDTLNCSKGVIFCTDLIGMTDEEIKEGLALFHPVKEVFTPKRIQTATVNGTSIAGQTPQPFGLVIITFDQLVPPTKVTVGFRKVEVRTYIPNPRRCRTCQKLGHTAKFCPTKKEVCAQCGQLELEDHNCSGTWCVNCNSAEHRSTDNKCPSWLMAKEIEKIIATENKTKYEAKKVFFELLLL